MEKNEMQQEFDFLSFAEFLKTFESEKCNFTSKLKLLEKRALGLYSLNFRKNYEINQIRNPDVMLIINL